MKASMNKMEQDILVDKFVYELPVIRARVDLTQGEIGEMVGLSRQTYSAIETRKRKMTWSNFMSLLFVFWYNPATRNAVEEAGIFTDELKRVLLVNRRLNNDKNK